MCSKEIYWYFPLKQWDFFFFLKCQNNEHNDCLWLKNDEMLSLSTKVTVTLLKNHTASNMTAILLMIWRRTVGTRSALSITTFIDWWTALGTTYGPWAAARFWHASWTASSPVRTTRSWPTIVPNKILLVPFIVNINACTLLLLSKSN